MKCWNCCAQLASITVATPANVQSSLSQSAQVAPRHRRADTRPGAEEPVVAVGEGRERVFDLLDQRSSQPSSGHTVT